MQGKTNQDITEDKNQQLKESRTRNNKSTKLRNRKRRKSKLWQFMFRNQINYS